MKGITGASFDLLEPRRLLAAIAPDITFGEGKPAGAQSNILLTTLANGEILAVGRLGGQGVTKLTADGTLDLSFGDNGVVNLPGRFVIGAAAVTSSDVFTEGVLAADLTNQEIRVVSLADGQLDQNFSGDGKEPVPFQQPGNGLTVEQFSVPQMSPTPDGGVLLTVGLRLSNDTGEAQLIKLKPNGSVDTSFANQGYLIISSPFVAGAWWTANGVVAVTDDTNGAATLFRYKTDGSLDATFGKKGSMSAGSIFGPSLLEQPNGQLVVIGEGTDSSEDARVTRFNINGSVDTSFGSQGTAVLADTYTRSYIKPLAIDSGNRILVITDQHISRLISAGKLDTTFNNTGSYALESLNTASSITADSMGRAIFGSDALVTRLDTATPIKLGANGVLIVNGTSANDHLSVTESGSTITAVFNGAQSTYAASDVTGFNVNADAGKNSITISVDLPAIVTTGDGDDTITTAGGADSINSNDGDDSINSGDGNDTVNAAGGDNTIISGDGNNQLSAGPGNNTVQFGNGGNGLDMGVGNQHITGGTGANLINLSDGNAQITLAGKGDTIQDGGTTGTRNITIAGGANTITMSSAGDETISVGGVAADFGNNIHTGPGHNSVTCSDSNDFIYVGGDDTVSAGAGNDIIQGGERGDTACHADGGSGDDIITPGDGDNVLTGGDGNDSLRTGSGNDSLYGGAGSDTLRAGAGSDLLSGGGGRDHLLAQQGSDRIYAGNGDDAIDAGPGDDRIFGQAGNDMIVAGSGNDQIDGGAGQDYLAAGPGDDTLTANDGERDSVYGGDGNDSATTDPSLDLLRSIETVH